MREYQVVGRKSNPVTEEDKKIYRMRIFAANKIVAKSRFWYFLGKLCKVKSMTGEILACNEIVEPHPKTIKNFGITLRYDSAHATHNLYKEFRDTTRCGAVKQLYNDMASHHGAANTSIHIIGVKAVAGKDVRRKNTQHFLNPRLSFPLIHQVKRTSKQYYRRFMPIRPTTF